MWKFIAITFGFLGLVFYQMSGGADFAPQSLEEEVIAARPVLEPIHDETVNASVPEAVTRAEKRVSLVGYTSTAPGPGSVHAGTARDLLPVGRVGERYEASFAVLPGPEQEVHTARAVSSEPVAEATPQDLRAVTGASVNLRGGPGTVYEVVGRLRRGDHVEVLEDDGSGWVQLEVLDTGETGWIADFLLAPL